jgi:hypothetical protein
LEHARRRIAVPSAQNRTAWEAVPEAATAALAEEAGRERGKPWPQPLVSHYARYFRDGNRTAYEDLVGERQRRLTRAVVMASLNGRLDRRPASGDGSDEWLDEVVDGAYLLCEQSSWCWASHDDAHTRLGYVVPDRNRPYLDLGAGEVVAQLAWLDHVLGPQLDGRAPGLRQRIREEALERVIRPFLDRTDWHWLGLDGHVHNWNPWIHSNVLVAALFLVEDRELQAATVARVIEGIDRFLAAIPADGAIDEGFSYWWNGAGRALEALALLEEASAGALAADVPVVRALVSFPHKMHVGGRWFLNVADGPARADGYYLPWNLVRTWAIRLGDEDAARHAEAMAQPEPSAAAGLGRMLRALTESGDDAAGTAPPAPPLTAFTYLDSVQIMLARETGGTTEGLLLTAKGGHNGENHNHKDLGSVTVAVDGVPLLVDAGQPTYTAQTFGPHRYEIRAMQSGWHSVPAPYGLEQGAGVDFAAAVRHRPTPDDSSLVLELAGAYGLHEDGSWTRTAVLDRSNSRAVIQDSWTLPRRPPTPSQDPSDAASPAAEDAQPPAQAAAQSAVQQHAGTPDVDIHYLLAGTVSLGPRGTATVVPQGIPAVQPAGATNALPGGGRTGTRGAVLRWNQPAAVVLMDEWLLDDPLLAEVWGTSLTRLRFRMPAGLREAGTFSLTVEATQ